MKCDPRKDEKMSNYGAWAQDARTGSFSERTSGVLLNGISRPQGLDGGLFGYRGN